MSSIPPSGGSAPKKPEEDLGLFKKVGSKDIIGRTFSYLSSQDIDSLKLVSKTFEKMSKKDWSKFLQEVNARVSAMSNIETDEKFKKQSEKKQYAALEAYIQSHKKEGDLKASFIEFLKEVMVNEEQGNVPIGVVEMFVKAGLFEDTNLYLEALNTVMGFDGGELFIKRANSHIYQMIMNEFRDSRLDAKEKDSIINDHFIRCKKSFVINKECLKALLEAGLKFTPADFRAFVEEGKRRAPQYLDQVCATMEFLIGKDIIPRDEVSKIVNELAPREADNKMAEEHGPDYARKQFFDRMRLAIKPRIQRATSMKKKDTSVDDVD